MEWKFELPDRSYSVSHIQDYFEHFIKNMKYQLKILQYKYLNKTANWVIFKFKTRYHLELLMSGVMKLLGSSENKITKDKKGEKVPHLDW